VGPTVEVSARIGSRKGTGLGDRDKLQRKVAKRRLASMERHVFVCVDDDCDRRLLKHLRKAIDRAGLRATAGMAKVRCFGICTAGPIVVVYPEGTWYARVTPEVADRIVTQHLRDGVPLGSHMFHRNPLCPTTGIAETA
jgi:(2Fe-2S) ferredoxin